MQIVKLTGLNSNFSSLYPSANYVIIGLPRNHSINQILFMQHINSFNIFIFVCSTNDHVWNVINSSKFLCFSFLIFFFLFVRINAKKKKTKMTSVRVCASGTETNDVCGLECFYFAVLTFNVYIDKSQPIKFTSNN